MAKKKKRANRNNTGNTCAMSTTTNPASTSVEVTGVLADDAVISTAIIADQDIKTAICTVAGNLQKHIDTAFSLRQHKIKINIDNVLIPGIPQYNSNDTLADVAKHLPPDSRIVMLYNPIPRQRKLLTNAVNQMAVDQAAGVIDRNAPPWPPSTDKLDHILNLVKTLGIEVDTLKDDNIALKNDNIALKNDNIALKGRVDRLEEENLVLREAIDGHTSSLYKLRRRTLLDNARKKILKKWAPHASKTTWNELRDAIAESDLKSFISSNQIFARTLDDDAFFMIYEWSIVREDGNDVAHGAEKRMVRDAVVYGDPENLQVLKNIFACVYGEDLP